MDKQTISSLYDPNATRLNIEDIQLIDNRIKSLAHGMYFVSGFPGTKRVSFANMLVCHMAAKHHMGVAISKSDELIVNNYHFSEYIKKITEFDHDFKSLLNITSELMHSKKAVVYFDLMKDASTYMMASKSLGLGLNVVGVHHAVKQEMSLTDTLKDIYQQVSENSNHLDENEIPNLKLFFFLNLLGGVFTLGTPKEMNNTYNSIPNIREFLIVDQSMVSEIMSVFGSTDNKQKIDSDLVINCLVEKYGRKVEAVPSEDFIRFIE